MKHILLHHPTIRTPTQVPVASRQGLVLRALQQPGSTLRQDVQAPGVVPIAEVALLSTFEETGADPHRAA